MDMPSFQKTLDERAKQDTQTTKDRQSQAIANIHTQAIMDTIAQAVVTLMKFQAQHQPKVSVTNQKLPTSIKTPDIQKVVDALEALKQPIQETKPDDTQIVDALNRLNDSIGKLPTSFPEAPEPVEEVTIKNQPDYKPDFQAVTKAISKIDVKPVVNIPEEKPDDYTPITDSLQAVIDAVKNIKIPKVPTTDLTPLIQATDAVQQSIQNLKFPVANYVLPFKDVNGKATQVQLDSSGNLPITASISGADGAIEDGVNSSIRATVIESTAHPGTFGLVALESDGSDISGGGGGGGAVTIADGADVAEGAMADAAYVSGSGSVISILKGIFTKLAGTLATSRTWTLGSGTDSVTTVPSGTQTISGTVTANAGTNLNTSALALESGGNLASIKTDLDEIALDTDNLDVALSTRLKPADTLTKVATVDTITNPVSVTGTFWQTTQPVSDTTSHSTLSSINTNVNKDSTGYTFYSSKITSTAGDTITPTSSKALKIHKVLVTNSANNSTFVDVSLTGATKGTFLQGEAIASSWVITLDVDEVLTIGTDVNGSVYVNIQYEEV